MVIGHWKAANNFGSFPDLFENLPFTIKNLPLRKPDLFELTYLKDQKETKEVK